MKQVPLGTRVKPLGINRSVCAQGIPSRAVLIDPNPRVKYTAYDETLKRRVEVDQDAVIKYRLRPMTNFYYLIGRLNTDMKGDIIGDDMVIEYLQLSESLNNDFSDQIVEQGVPESLKMELVSKKANGRDFSYIKVTTSKVQPSQEIMNKVKLLQSNPEAIESMWQMIDASTSITIKEYEKLLKESKDNPQLETRVTRQAVPTPQPVAMIEDPANNDFGDGDPFNDADWK